MDLFDHLRTMEKKNDSTRNESVETLTNDPATSEINAKTEKYVENIEHKVDEIYQSLEKNTTNGWKSFNGFLTNFQKNIPEYVNQTKEKLEKLSVLDGDEEDEDEDVEEGGSSSKEQKKSVDYLKTIKESTNSYLDDLDNDLQEVEKIVGGFASTFGSKLGSLLKEVIKPEDENNARASSDIDDDNDESLEIDGKDSKMLFNVPDSKVFGTRQEQRLHQLNNSKELYLEEVSDKAGFEEFKSKYTADEAKNEKELSSNTDLSKLFKTIVPSEISADEFWLKFFYNKNLIELEENTRKKLLADTKKTSEEEENFDWDDDEEEEESALPSSNNDNKAESRTSSEVTYNLESANSSTLDVVSSKKSDKKGDEKAEDEDEDDDWE